MSTWVEDAIAKVRAALAEDEHTHTLDVEILVSDDSLVLVGDVQNEERRHALEQVARAAVPRGIEIINRTVVTKYAESPRPAPIGALRVAAVGDIHVGEDSVGAMRERLSAIAHHADVLLLAGDLTQHGTAREGRVLADDLRGLSVPVVAVLGNHDYHAGAETEIRRALEDAGVRVLEGESTTLELRGRSLGIAGVKGFGSGFAGACGTEFGEPEMKAFVHYARIQGHKLEEAMRGLSAEVRIALTHYSPVADTLHGERREIYPFLGSYFLGEAIDATGCDLAVHGHAHHGQEHGVTPAGVPVRNVAQHVIGEAYRVYRVDARTSITVQPWPDDFERGRR